MSTATHTSIDANTDTNTGAFRLAVIVGSTREGRFAPVVSNWFAAAAERHGDFEVDIIDLAHDRLPDVWAPMGSEPAAVVAAVGARLAAADAFVVVTPEYNHSFPAGLKNMIDLFRGEWQGKPVGFVSYGGISGGLRAVEQLRLVFAEQHMVTTRDGLAFPMAWEKFDAEGQPVDVAGTEAAAKVMLDQLAWWSEATRSTRVRRPYGV
ncbi:NADPH-dependent FMN reductase [Embleya scabrispora]|jgi:NAD(P)H-dependent FMN reductase|uniref:NADPH-dependent FMN reductase n=1 Tax=Embleya scabrispora TaxID=159449 RepID=UPI00038024AC|nr:NAD(P)H-dependent oxidoreductase [Embleya scabrispora]MYS84116.1 NADPH-dependent FMN reductase [Streptomyces sp. SID5474]